MVSLEYVRVARINIFSARTAPQMYIRCEHTPKPLESRKILYIYNALTISLCSLDGGWVVKKEGNTLENEKNTCSAITSVLPQQKYWLRRRQVCSALETMRLVAVDKRYRWRSVVFQI